jgi:hypothetical protein
LRPGNFPSVLPDDFTPEPTGFPQVFPRVQQGTRISGKIPAEQLGMFGISFPWLPEKEVL